MATVETGARLHFGFQNLALAHERLYGGIGAALASPRLVVDADTAESVGCSNGSVLPYVERAVDVLGVPGGEVTVRKEFGRHVGLGSGTQLALAVFRALADAYGVSVDVSGSFGPPIPCAQPAITLIALPNETRRLRRCISVASP